MGGNLKREELAATSKMSQGLKKNFGLRGKVQSGGLLRECDREREGLRTKAAPTVK